MMDNQNQEAKPQKSAYRWLLRETLGNLFLIAMLFGIVGRIDWWNGWAMSAIYILWSVGSVIFILPVNPQMLAERARPQAGAKKWDVVMVSLMGVFILATYIIACLDIRFGWAPPFPLPLQIAGVAVGILAYDGLLLWSMVSNAYFTAIVRIQTDRHHSVASGGPYRFVRHPGYIGTILFYLATPFLFGSVCALLPALLASIVLVVRTVKEDATLQAELPGYSEYARQTRYRLIPGIW